MKDIIRSFFVGLVAGLVVVIISAIVNHIGVDVGTGHVSIVVSLIVGFSALHYWKTLHFRALREEFRTVNNRVSVLNDHVAETQGLVQLARFNDAYPLPFGGGWALTADAAAVLVREIALNRPRNIIELGSGVSTQLIGRMLKEAGGGKLYSLDHDSSWAEQTRHHIHASGLADYVEVLDAPLEKQHFSGEEFNWYRLPEALRNFRDIDLIVVDGPPQSLDPNGIPRYPALPAFYAQLSSEAAIFIDDAKRPHEQKMISRWQKEFPEFESRMIETVPGTCVFKRRM